MSAKRREKFQDSNALIQLSRQLLSKQAAETAVATDEKSPDLASRAQRPATQSASLKRPERSKRPSPDEGTSVQVKSKHQKRAPASAQQLEVFPVGQTLESLNTAAMSVQTKSHTAAPAVQLQQPASVCHDKSINKQVHAPCCDLVSWYANVCTQGFAGQLSALHQSQDSSHAQPRLLSRCMRMNAALFEGKQSILQSMPWQTPLSPFQHVSLWL